MSIDCHSQVWSCEHVVGEVLDGRHLRVQVQGRGRGALFDVGWGGGHHRGRRHWCDAGVAADGKLLGLCGRGA